ncbi:hypothetical protein [Novosphingobium sp. KN65.2]|uniref:hypothetical protein n=1 Tax=Novosphingobium sp. KN65.2 TaxID=1478134 RepID=UPI0005E4A5F1|nr:hypothetical protein [Novosphingobium sp. KN65.2]CDO37923.1 hypothetical protein SPHV1_470014 [Novosphingobium sp. KN65.2]
MSTCPTRSGESELADAQADLKTEALRKDLRLGLQLCRANTLSLTRLQLALKSGDRRSTLEAIDRLHALDTQMGRLVRQVPGHANDDPEMQALARHVDEQNMAIAFEKLALVSAVSGPNLVSRHPAWNGGRETSEDFPDLPDPGERLPDLPDHLIVVDELPYRKWLGVLLGLLVFMAIAFAAVFALTG